MRAFLLSTMLALACGFAPRAPTGRALGRVARRADVAEEAATDFKPAAEVSALTKGVETKYSVEDIMKILPHRYPFALVDKVVAYEPGESAVGIKQITFNEPQFGGHFPDRPIMPGAMQIEALAQLAGVVCLQMEGAEPGAVVVWSPRAFGRSARVWGADASMFRPGRAPDDGVDDAGDLAALAFGAGGRACIGRALAIAVASAAVDAIRGSVDLRRSAGAPGLDPTAAVDDGAPLLVVPHTPAGGAGVRAVVRRLVPARAELLRAGKRLRARQARPALRAQRVERERHGGQGLDRHQREVRDQRPVDVPVQDHSREGHHESEPQQGDGDARPRGRARVVHRPLELV